MARRPEREQYGGGRILIQEYNPKWPLMFDRERAAIAASLDRYVVAIEHIGSTAVPGLPAKPIIDLLVGVENLAEARPDCLTQLQARGYTYMAEYETWLPDEMLFRRGMPGPWTHHAHVVEASRSTWCDYLLLRDYLRSHEEVHAHTGTSRGRSPLCSRTTLRVIGPRSDHSWKESSPGPALKSEPHVAVGSVVEPLGGPAFGMSPESFGRNKGALGRQEAHFRLSRSEARRLRRLSSRRVRQNLRSIRRGSER
jgi:GrpB-like predicted nucleotidyltransferase (UPF0157 family)